MGWHLIELLPNWHSIPLQIWVNLGNKLFQESQVEALRGFMQLLTEESHQQLPGSKVLWYDSVTRTGELKWQDQLNDENRCVGMTHAFWPPVLATGWHTFCSSRRKTGVCWNNSHVLTANPGIGWNAFRCVGTTHTFWPYDYEILCAAPGGNQVCVGMTHSLWLPILAQDEILLAAPWGKQVCVGTICITSILEDVISMPEWRAFARVSRDAETEEEESRA